MNARLFNLQVPEDLKPFHDLLLEQGDGDAAKCVNRMIKEGKFPAFMDDCWYWSTSEHRRDRDPFRVPTGSLCHPSQFWYFSAKEAVWAVINAGKYK